jgi:hypothetical protein
LERAKGIEPSYEAWEASVLPLNYARDIQDGVGFAKSRPARLRGFRDNCAFRP